MDEFLKEENYLQYGLLSRKLVSMEVVYDRSYWRWWLSPFLSAKKEMALWKELNSSQKELLLFIQDETQAPRARGQTFWLLHRMATSYQNKTSTIPIDFPKIDNVHILLRLFLKLFETDTTFHVWERFYTYYVADLGDVAIPYFYKHLDNYQLAPKGAYTGAAKDWVEPLVMYNHRYADYAAWCIERITNIPLHYAATACNNPTDFEKNDGSRAEKIAEFKIKLQAYCAERGISLG